MVRRNNLYQEVKPEYDLYYAGVRVYDDTPGFIYAVTVVKEEGEVGSLNGMPLHVLSKQGITFMTDIR